MEQRVNLSFEKETLEPRRMGSQKALVIDYPTLENCQKAESDRFKDEPVINSRKRLISNLIH